MIDSDFGPDPMALLCREVLRERTPALIAEACAWAVGLSDHPHFQRVRGRVVPSGSTLGARAANGQPLGGEEDGRLELGDARPGSFQDALNALGADGVLHAERFDRELVEPFVLDTCVQAAERSRATRTAEWAELLDELGEDGADLVEVVRVGEWEAPLRIDAEHLVLAAIGAVPLVEVEAEGLPLSLVRAAEAVTRAAAPVPAPTGAAADELAGALFLAEAAVRGSGLTLPVPLAQADRLLDVLLAEGLLPEEVPALLSQLPVEPVTAAEVRATLAALGG
ncbi:hypothetical protein O2W14_10390 [Modestobacter sp. VKM Ac-2986]|uniref:hypothetical protein n=1 Tax=Modestobacter sp. VKM Ac-2986 TaxID=3004140 RepID=UPI0022ABA58E|nr:hypothetical protein [Modestobacter sp. VKM Ac-2986]MCZ2829239.1 hypothetical protein [Modestobacter sp. VKM Ac-2986]